MSRRTLIWLAASCAAAAVLVVLIGGVGSLGAFQLVTVRLTPEGRFEVGALGDWVVASQTRAVVDGVPLVGAAVTAEQLHLLSPSGAAVPIRVPDYTMAYQRTDRAGEVIGHFDAAQPGSWRVRLAGGGDGVLLAVGPNPLQAVSLWMLVSGAIAIVLLGAACGLGWIAWRR